VRAIALLVFASACAMNQTQQNSWVHAPDYYSIDANGTRSDRYSRVNAYTEFGADGLGAQSKISEAYASAQHAPPPATDAIFNAELPPGLSVDGRVVKVDPRASFEPIAQYEIEYQLGAAPPETDIVDDLQRLAKVTGADAIVVEVQRVGDADPRVKQLAGFALRRRDAVTAAPPMKRKTALLDYRATGDNCPSSADVSTAIAKRLGYTPWDPGATATMRADVVAIERGYAGSVRFGDAAPRTLRGSTCQRVTDAMISIAVIQLD